MEPLGLTVLLVVFSFRGVEPRRRGGQHGNGQSLAPQRLELEDVVQIGLRAVLVLLCEALGTMGLGRGESPRAVGADRHVAQEVDARDLFLPNQGFEVFREQGGELLAVQRGQDIGHLLGANHGLAPGTAKHAPVVPEPGIVGDQVQAPPRGDPAREHQHRQGQHLRHAVVGVLARVVDRLETIPETGELMPDQPKQRLAYPRLGVLRRPAAAARFSGT